VTVQAWLLFCATETVLSLTPSPAVLLAASVALTRGGDAGLLASLGILVANAVYFALSATGLGALLHTSWEACRLIK
jgi:threonine/homoserine/homoserine lactone efflux protein